MPLVNSMEVPEAGTGRLFSSPNRVDTVDTKVFEHLPTSVGGFAGWALPCIKVKAITVLIASAWLRELGNMNFTEKGMVVTKNNRAAIAKLGIYQASIPNLRKRLASYAISILI